MLQVSNSNREAASSATADATTQNIERIRTLEARLRESTHSFDERVAALEGHGREHRLQLETLGRASRDDSERHAQVISQLRVDMDQRVRSLEDWRLRTHSDFHAEFAQLSKRLLSLDRQVNERDACSASTADVTTTSTASSTKDVSDKPDVISSLTTTIKLLSGRCEEIEHRSKEHNERLGSLDGRVDKVA